MLNQIRLIQSYQQSLNLKTILKNKPIGAYIGRDTITGDRLIQSADGGMVRLKYLSDSQPLAVPTVQKPNKIGLTGYMDQL